MDPTTPQPRRCKTSSSQVAPGQAGAKRGSRFQNPATRLTWRTRKFPSGGPLDPWRRLRYEPFWPSNGLPEGRQEANR